MPETIKHLDICTFRINKHFKQVAQDVLGDNLATVCRNALLKAVEDKRGIKRNRGRSPAYELENRIRAVIE